MLKQPFKAIEDFLNSRLVEKSDGFLNPIKRSRTEIFCGF